MQLALALFVGFEVGHLFFGDIKELKKEVIMRNDLFEIDGKGIVFIDQKEHEDLQKMAF